jgi:microcystin-dependent protein
MSEAFMGEIKAYGFQFAPRNFAFCNGATLGISQNSALFALLGTTFGGNGQTTFQLPSLGGRTAIGQGQSAGTSQYVMGEVGGTENTTLTQLQMPMHTHIAATTVTPTYTAPTVSVMMNGVNRPSARQAAPGGAMLTGGIDSVNNNALNNYCLPSSGTAVALASESCTTTVSGGSVTATAGTTISTAGGSQPFSIQSPYLAINYCICTVGIFPSRN